MLLVGPHWNKQQLFWDRQRESGANSIITSSSVVLSWCLAPDGFPVPTKVLALSGSLCLAAVAPGAVQLYCHQPYWLCCLGDVLCRQRWYFLLWCFWKASFQFWGGFFLLRKVWHQCRTKRSWESLFSKVISECRGLRIQIIIYLYVHTLLRFYQY